jgi:hypothetical protein
MATQKPHENAPTPETTWSARDREALAAVIAEMQIAPFNTPPTKLMQAGAVVEAGRVQYVADRDSYEVAGAKNTYHVTQGMCDCPHGEHHPDERFGCYHAVAVEIFARWLHRREALGDPEDDHEPEHLAAPLLGFPASLEVKLVVPEIVLKQPGPTMAEAPYSATVSVENIDGYELLLTVRKTEGGEFIKAVKKLLEWCKDEDLHPKKRFASREATPKTTDTASTPPSGPPTCRYHGPMKPSEKAPGTFYCTKKMGDGSGYCRERWPAEKAA